MRLIAYLSGIFLIAAVQLPESAWAQANSPTYRPFRYDDDFRYLRKSDHHRDFWDPIKDMRLWGDDAYLSFGGELRERFESFTQPNFGLRGHNLDQYALQRILVHADVHLSNYLRTFIELEHAVQIGRSPVTPTDENHLDFHQGFLDIRLPISDGDGLTIRAGRQEIGLGSQRLISVREGTNIRRSFDGFRLFEKFGDIAVDVLGVRPVLLNQGTFNDRPDNAQSLWGIYSTMPVLFVPSLKLDLYYLGFQNQQAQFGGTTGDEQRSSFGVRLFGNSNNWDWNFEAVGQIGSFANQEIRAWTLASDTGFTFSELPWKPRLGLKANIASGSEQKKGGTLGTFNPLFPKLPYFSEATLTAPSNFFDIYPSIRFQPTPDISFMIGWDFLWRESTQDAVYGAPLISFAGTAQTTGKIIGNQIVVEGQWQLQTHLTLLASYVHFTAGDALTEAGGKDVDFVMVSVSYKF